MIPPSRWDARLLGVFDECAGVKTFRLSVPEDFSFQPGMWVMFHFEDAPKVERAYSIASSPLERGYIEITLNAVGDFTRRVFALKPGEAIAARGPFGKFVFTDDMRRAALVSGGTGITPFRSMARYAIAKGLHAELSLFYSSRTSADAIYGAELSEFSRAGVKVHRTITRPESSPESWDGPTGRITVDLLEKELPHFSSTHFFLCGPAKLVKDLSGGLRERGIDGAQIHHESWGDYSI